VVIIAIGVDPVDCVPAREPPPDLRALAGRRPLILFLGRLSWKKGLDHLLHAFARTEVGTLAIVGTDDENLAPQLSQLAIELNIAHRMCLVPRTVTGPDKEFVFSSADVFVLPSHSENFGNAVLEAMQRALPVIVTESVGASEVVRDSGGGIVVAGDVAQIGAAIQRMVRNPELYQLLGKRGQRFVNDHYGWADIAVRMETLYESLAAQRR
jgi:glycosyltransferase involved in cell wall biosynthesis